MLPKFNGISLRDGEYLKDAKNATLNMMLGKDGMPKYSQGQLKSITKTMLLAEITPLYEEAMTKVEVVAKVLGKRGAKRKPAKNKSSAASKKCRLIENLANGKLTIEEVHEIYADDSILRSVCKWEELLYAVENKTRPGTRKSVKVTIDEGGSGYIVAKGSGIYAE